MLKEQVILKDYNKKSVKSNQILFTKVSKDGIKIQILVLDEPAGKNLKMKQLDVLAQIFQGCLSNSKQNLTLLRLLKGLSGVQKYLSSPDHWCFESQSRKFKLTNKIGSPIHQFVLSKNNKFDLFDLKDIINVLKDSELSEIETKYLLNKAFQIICDEKEGKKLMTKQQLLANKQIWFEQAEKSKKKKLNEKQMQICKYIRTDSYNFDSFDVSGLCITKQYENIQRCLFGCISIATSNQFAVKIDKLSKQNRDPAIWIGVTDISYLKSEEIGHIPNIFAMSDQKKIRYCSQLKKNQKITPKNRLNELKLVQFQAGDTIKVNVNQEEGVITWRNSNNEELGNHQSQYLKMKNIQWVPFVELWKKGDAISWCI